MFRNESMFNASKKKKFCIKIFEAFKVKIQENIKIIKK